MSKVITILDNGSGKRGQSCDDCGTALRYEYHTDDGGIYGSECVHRHIHDQDWLSYKAARDAKLMAAIKRQYAEAIKHTRLQCTIYSDDSATIRGISRYGENGTKVVIDRLIAEGWKLKRLRSGGMPRSTVYTLASALVKMHMEGAG
jgi:hypothetical protein